MGRVMFLQHTVRGSGQKDEGGYLCHLCLMSPGDFCSLSWNSTRSSTAHPGCGGSFTGLSEVRRGPGVEPLAIQPSCMIGLGHTGVDTESASSHT
jgi:hypothetical protein